MSNKGIQDPFQRAIVIQLEALNNHLELIADRLEDLNRNHDDISETTADICRILFDITGSYSDKSGDKRQALRVTGRMEDGHIWHHPQCDF